MAGQGRLAGLRLPLSAAALTVLATLSCAGPPPAASPGREADPRPPRRRLEQIRPDPFLDDLQARTFRFFWERANPANGLVPDRWPTPSFSSVAAVGFALTAYPIGVERGFITREQARERVRTTLRFFHDAPQGPEPRGRTGYKGFFYHFLDMTTGARWATDVELSTMDTALLLGGVLTCQQYFSGDHPEEAEIRGLAEEIYERVDWRWAQPRPPLVSMGWTPEGGFHFLDWRGYNEAMIVYLLALGSPTFATAAEGWQGYTASFVWGDYYGFQHVGFAPLFGHQFTHLWIDFRGIRDAYMRDKAIDYFENSRRATYAQRAYAIANPAGFAAYGANAWGLTACDGPADVTLTVNGRPMRFFSYAARGTSHTETRDDGTIAPYAAAASLPFAPEIAIPALKSMHQRWGEHLYSTYGFLDAFNPTFTFTDVKLVLGRVTPGVGWFDTDYLGIDQGPIIAMIENYRSDLIWKTMRKNKYIVSGLKKAGFTGGWLGN